MSHLDPVILAVENIQVLNLVQAMLGGISPNMRAICLEITPRGVGLHFLLAQDDPTDREDIEDIVFEFEALQERGLDVDVAIVASRQRDALVSLPGRKVFLRREELGGRT